MHTCAWLSTEVLGLKFRSIFHAGGGEDENIELCLASCQEARQVLQILTPSSSSLCILVYFLSAQLLREPLTSDSVSKTRPVTPDIRGPKTDFYDDRHSLQFKPIDSISRITIYLEFLKSREANSRG